MKKSAPWSFLDDGAFRGFRLLEHPLCLIGRRFKREPDDEQDDADDITCGAEIESSSTAGRVAHSRRVENRQRKLCGEIRVQP